MYVRVISRVSFGNEYKFSIISTVQLLLLSCTYILFASLVFCLFALVRRRDKLWNSAYISKDQQPIFKPAYINIVASHLQLHLGVSKHRWAMMEIFRMYGLVVAFFDAYRLYTRVCMVCSLPDLSRRLVITRVYCAYAQHL